MRAFRTLLLVAICVWCAVPSASAGTVKSAKDWKKLKATLVKQLGDKTGKSRLRAIERLGYADWPDAVKMLLKILKAPDPKAVALEKRFAKLTKFIQQINKSVRDRGMLITADEKKNRNDYFNEQRKLRTALNALAFTKRKVVEALSLTRDVSARELIVAACEKEKDAVVKAHLLIVCGRLDDKDAADVVRAAVAQEDRAWVRTAAIAALGERIANTEKSSADLSLLLGALNDEAWPVRGAAIDALKALGKKALPEAVEPLLQLLAEEEGRLRGDISDALSAMTGAAVGPDAELWRSWWEANKAKVLGGKDGEAVSDEQKKHGTTSTFYGIPTTSKRIAFVIDLSGSMNEPANVPEDPAERRRQGGATSTGGHAGGEGPPSTDPSQKPLPPAPTKLDVMKRALMRAIWQLPDDAIFALVGYHEEAQVLGRGIMKATRASKVDVGKMVDTWAANGGTNTYDALLLALSLGQDKKAPDKKFADGIDTIFLLSDGLPSFGKVTEPGEIVADIVERVRTRRVKIHTIWVDTGDGGRNPAVKAQAEEGGRFMRELAEKTGGSFVKR